MKKVLMLATALLMMTSCATIIHGTKQKVSFKSESNKTITVYDKYGNVYAKGKDLVLELPKKSSNGVDLQPKVNEFVAKTDTETKKLIPYKNAAYVYGNFFTFGIGNLVDTITGAGYTLQYNDQEAVEILFK